MVLVVLIPRLRRLRWIKRINNLLMHDINHQFVVFKRPGARIEPSIVPSRMHPLPAVPQPLHPIAQAPAHHSPEPAPAPAQPNLSSSDGVNTVSHSFYTDKTVDELKAFLTENKVDFGSIRGRGSVNWLGTTASNRCLCPR
jgi:hypothetical protein